MGARCPESARGSGAAALDRLSVLSFNAVPKHAENLKISLKAQAQKMLSYVETDLETAARARALEAARAVGPETLLEGRPKVVRAALRTT